MNLNPEKAGEAHGKPRGFGWRNVGTISPLHVCELHLLVNCNGPVAYKLRYFNNMQIKCDVTSIVLFAAILYRLCMACNGDSYSF